MTKAQRDIKVILAIGELVNKAEQIDDKTYKEFNEGIASLIYLQKLVDNYKLSWTPEGKKAWLNRNK